MEMKLTDAMKFFGLPPMNKEFDAYLTSLDIHERPTFNQKPTERISKYADGYSLIFEGKLGYEESWGPAREDGDMIFCQVQLYSEHNDSNFARFKKLLPYGLTFETTLQQALTLFGEPATDHESGSENHVYVWYNHGGFTVSICFLPNDRGISFLSIEKDMLNPPEKFDW